MIQKIKWISHRASVMPFEEYVYRFNNLISGIFNFFLLKSGNKVLPSICFPERNILRNSIFSDVLDNGVSKILPEKYKNQCISEAGQIAQNRFSFFDFENY